MERQRNPGSAYEPLNRSRIPLRSIRTTFIPSSLPGLTRQSMPPFGIGGLAAKF